MNLMKKTAPWMVASLLAATSVFGQSKCPPAQKSFEQGHELMQNQLMAAYNAPARIDVRGAWDVYATGSFTYWQAIQENMEVGLTNELTTTDTLAGNWINMDFGYKPGFKAGLGMNFDHDNWDGYAEYTWFRGHNSVFSNGPAAGSISPAFGHPALINQNAFNTASERWKLHMDFVDVEMARSYYVGTRLSFRPFFGARGAWIRQRLHTRYVNESIIQATTHVVGVPGTLDTTQKLYSWGVGPRVGLYSNWMIGQGFRTYGNAIADILYTRYTHANYFETFVDTATATTQTFHTRQHNNGTVRTHLDLEIGLGWGSYFDNNNWHVDLSAGYGFQVFFDQNMFRHYTDDFALANSNAPNGNLYVQGMTATLRVDF